MIDPNMASPVAPETELLKSFYTELAPPERKLLLETQDEEIRGEKFFVTCECGSKIRVRYGYRCLYCGVWFCASCAEIHFEETIQAHWDRRRTELRVRLEKLLAKNPQRVRLVAPYTNKRANMYCPKGTVFVKCPHGTGQYLKEGTGLGEVGAVSLDMIKYICESLD